jgi:hypothetical protein
LKQPDKSQKEFTDSGLPRILATVLLASLRISEVTTLSTGTLVCRFTVGMVVAPGGSEQGKRENLLVQTANLDQLQHKLQCSKFPCDVRGLNLVAPSEEEGEAKRLGL